MKTAIVLMMTFASSSALAEEKPAAPLPPGWSTQQLKILQCPRCVGLGLVRHLGKCTSCEKAINGAFRLCPVCSLKQKKCGRCGRGFPPQPTPGLRLEVSWLRPGRKVTDPYKKVEDAKSVPIWVRVVNTTKRNIEAPDFPAYGRNPKFCTTLFFVARSDRQQKILFSVSPWRRRSARPPLPLVFRPGTTDFERDLAECVSARGALGPGRWTITAAVGWLESNALTLDIGDVDKAPPKPARRSRTADQ